MRASFLMPVPERGVDSRPFEITHSAKVDRANIATDLRPAALLAPDNESGHSTPKVASASVM
jgi:hypothetical protein